ncbi:hypothetical protein EDD29_6643 [Actinocorallia herbida]|uniref:Uncharacterized protein n=1 Tax=Actinocorallia herbida TaxID=58109 RepID=A0A3N1D673_9ACTN|nr:hypothetical protein [Actinocorallia herbida]ROO88956.1 hypothetical protein EDD29_6643 [Actinocorallia herbida]
MMLRIAVAVLSAGLCVSGCEAPAMDDATVRRLTEQGVDPDFIFRAEVPGFTAEEKTVEPLDGGGFRMRYVSDSNSDDHAELQVHPVDFTAESCASTPIPNADSAAPVECVDNGKGLYRSGGGFHEYVHSLQHGHIRLSAPIDAISPTDLRDALNESESLWGPASHP